MKAYQKLVFEMINFSANDVVRTSIGQEQTEAEAAVVVKDLWGARTDFN